MNQHQIINHVPYQKCPVCDGTGQVPCAGMTTSSNPLITCDVCNGSKIIPMHVVKVSESKSEISYGCIPKCGSCEGECKNIAPVGFFKSGKYSNTSDQIIEKSLKEQKKVECENMKHKQKQDESILKTIEGIEKGKDQTIAEIKRISKIAGCKPNDLTIIGHEIESDTPALSYVQLMIQYKKAKDQKTISLLGNEIDDKFGHIIQAC